MLERTLGHDAGCGQVVPVGVEDLHVGDHRVLEIVSTARVGAAISEPA
jgi:hypothetical protein